MPSVAAGVVDSRSAFALQPREIPQEFQDIMRLRSGRTVVRRIRPEDIGPLLAAARRVIGARMASEEVVRRIAASQPDALWTFCRKDRVVGYLAMLMLNCNGLEVLLSDTFDFCDPPLSLLANSDDTPAAIYIWGVLAPPLAVDGVAEVMSRLRSDKYNSANIYAFQNTVQGARFQRRLGFAPVLGHPRNLYRYVRLCNHVH
jgi:hypothetical protein